MTGIPRATDTELLILKILWDNQPCPVRFVSEELSRMKSEEVKYTTALKLMQLMHEKGLVTRDESDRTHLYSAAHPREKMQRHVLSELASKIFGGATADLAMQALSAGKVEPEELRRLKTYIDKQLENEEGS